MSFTPRYAEVIVNRAIDRVDRVFHYRVPPHLELLVKIGTVVAVPFGNQQLEGVVVGFVDQPEVSQIKDINGVVSEHPLLNTSLIKLAQWMSEYYLCPRAAVFQAMVPAGLKLQTKMVMAKTVECVYLLATAEELSEIKWGGAIKQKEICQFLVEHNGAAVMEVLRATGASRTSLHGLTEKKLVTVVPREVYRDPYSGELFEVVSPEKLTYEQEAALAAIQEESEGERRPVLIHGITGSGKTEIYLHMIEHILKIGKQVIVLVPEIALTPQLVAVFKSRLREKVAVLHSGLSAGERRDAWTYIARGDIKVVVGARSAVFAPCPDLGLVIMDEEHEQSYKQETIPRFHARDVAAERCRIQGAMLILGSATPSMESYYKAEQGIYRLVTLASRVWGRNLPTVKVVDMREELKSGNRTIFSTTLQQKLRECLAKGEQSLLFLNRRGYNTFVSCRECGHVVSCPHCAISLTLHIYGNRLKCHYCGYQAPVVIQCPHCNSKAIRHFGTGTQRVEEEVKKLMPTARVARVDLDTTSQKGAYDRIYRQVRNREVDVLVGTQMIAKGLDFPGVTLVGVIAADLTLHLPEMRAAERTFQLLTQVAGRAGRGDSPGEVIIQTYCPTDPSVVSAAGQHYRDFYRSEIIRRQELLYPPFGHMIRILLTSPDQPNLLRTIQQVARYIAAETEGTATIMGPAPAPLERIKDRYRMHFVLKGSDLPVMRQAVTRGMEKAKKDGLFSKDINITIDVEPLNMM